MATTKTAKGGMTRQAGIRFETETFDRLQTLAAATGRTVTYYVREAVEEHLDDLEDIYIAEKRLADLKAGRSRTHTLEEVSRELGLDD